MAVRAERRQMRGLVDGFLAPRVRSRLRSASSSRPREAGALHAEGMLHVRLGLAHLGFQNFRRPGTREIDSWCGATRPLRREAQPPTRTNIDNNRDPNVDLNTNSTLQYSAEEVLELPECEKRHFKYPDAGDSRPIAQCFEFET